MSDMKVFHKSYYVYDDEIDALLIHNKQEYVYDSSIELDHDIILDYDRDGIPVAIELLNASKIFNFPKESLKTIDNVHIHVKITEESILLELNFDVCFDNKKQKCFFDSLKSNTIPLPNIELKVD